MALETAHHENATSSTSIGVQPLSVHTGAEISGVDLSQPLTSDEVQAIRAELLKWKVVFFRGQHLDHQKHIAFARQFGELTPGHVVFGNDDTYPEIYSVAKHRTANRHRDQIMLRPWSGWHADITAAINPPAASILRGDIVPPMVAIPSGPISSRPTMRSRLHYVNFWMGCTAFIVSQLLKVYKRRKNMTIGFAKRHSPANILSSGSIQRRENGRSISARHF